MVDPWKALTGNMEGLLKIVDVNNERVYGTIEFVLHINDKGKQLLGN